MKTASLTKKALPLALLTLLAPTLAHAHTGIGATHGFGAGMAHPLTGLDHICAMVAVGLWAAQRGGRALWMVPLTFVSVMALGGALGMAGIAIPFVEPAIIVSVLALGVLIAAAVRLPLIASTLIVGLFAIFHGHAHGAEMPETASGFAYGLGFILTTALLHVGGIGLGVVAQQISTPRLVRAMGAVIALCGVYLWLA